MREIVLVLIAAVTLAGCGRDLVGGGQKEVEVAAVGDGGTGGSAASVPPGAALVRVVHPDATLTFTAAVALVAEGGGIAPVTTEPRTVQIEADGRQSFVEARVPATRYARVRVVFTDVQAEVRHGFLGVTGLVRVAVPPGGIVVERDVALNDPGRRDVLVVDLNASAWITAAVAGVVPASVFESAVSIRVE